MPFNPIDHPICLAWPDRTAESAWLQHTPFAMLLIELLRPRLFVELGVQHGSSYCAFCQAVSTLNVQCRCVGVDSWKGDEHAGMSGTDQYGSDVLAELQAYHELRYSAFSTLMQASFDDAVANFSDGSIDLLHIDGYHTYEAVRHDFDTWAAKMSARGVVLLHDICERKDDFGVYRLWDELKAQYPLHLELGHGHGLGVVVVGGAAPDGLQPLLDLSPAEFSRVEQLFADLGQRVEAIQAASGLQSETTRLSQESERLQGEMEALRQEAAELRDDAQILRLASVRREVELSRSRQLMRNTYTDLSKDLLATRRDYESRVTDLSWRLNSAESQLAALETSRGVRMVKLARAARAVLNAHGPLGMSKRVGLWLIGRRGYHLRDINLVNGTISLADGAYNTWFLQQRATSGQLKQQRESAKSLDARPLISFVVPVYNPGSDVLADTIASVQAQTYDNWELCFADGHSTAPGVREVLKQSAERDPRIHVTFLEKNLGISGNSNAALRMAQGEFVALLDHDDLIEPDLLYEVVQTLNAQPDADVVYFDEDRASADGERYEQPFFKPNWSPELLLCNPFPMHSVIRRQVLNEVEGFRPAADGTQDWDLFLRLSERTNRFTHIPRVLYHWRMVPGSAAAAPDAKPYVWERQRLAIQGHMQRLGHPDAKAYFAAPGILRVVWKPEPVKVSIIIPTKDKVAVLRRCITSIQALTDYSNYEIVLVDTGSVEQATEDYYDTFADDDGIRLIRYQGDFNYSRVCNIGANEASGDLFLFLNNDVEVMDEDWLEELVRWASVPEIGIVGGKLLYPDGRIQHAGVVLGMSGLAAHLWYECQDHIVTLFGSTDWYRNMSAVTGALHMMRREVYEAVGGYDETYHISYSDVAICAEVIKLGYRVLFDPFVRLIHYESQTRDRKPSEHDTRLAGEHLRSIIEAGDPYYNPSLSYMTSIPTLRGSAEVSRLQMLERLAPPLTQMSSARRVKV